MVWGAKKVNKDLSRLPGMVCEQDRDDEGPVGDSVP